MVQNFVRLNILNVSISGQRELHSMTFKLLIIMTRHVI
jgi:hypothetical protein